MTEFNYAILMFIENILLKFSQCFYKILKNICYNIYCTIIKMFENYFLFKNIIQN